MPTRKQQCEKPAKTSVKEEKSKKVTNSSSKSPINKSLKSLTKEIVDIECGEIDRTIKIISDTISIDKFEFVYDSVIEAIEEDDQTFGISSSSEDIIDVLPRTRRRDIKTVFDMDEIADPLTGTPMEVRKELDNLAFKLQKNPLDQASFVKIVCYMHKYILGLVFKKYSFVKGYDDKDIYQEALIALFKKAVPSFRKGKGMSFLNFAKMCINRHLITILNASINRRKDMPLNTSISLDHAPLGKEDDGDESCILSNIIPDTVNGKPPFTEMDRSESFDRTFDTINSVLSDFEKEVLIEYLKDKSYKDAAKSMAKTHGKTCNERSIDNALLRIRKKAMALKDTFGEDALPLVFGNVKS
jgi:RNA polymerase sporulation-specific sigma factor